MNIVGITGSAGSGKDTLADMIKSDGWERFAYADALKHICMDYLGLSYNDAYTQEGKTKFNEFWGMTNREILQKVGTDAMRNGFCKDVWIKIAELKLKEMLDSGKKVIVTDVRFDNEAELIESLGGCVAKIVRNVNILNNAEQSHVSEKGISDDLISFVIQNNLSKEDLKTEFNVKLLEFENKFTDIYNSLNNETFKDELKDFILKCKKFISVIPNSFTRTQSNNVRFEWFNDNFNKTCVLITNFNEKTLNFTMFKNRDVIDSWSLDNNKKDFDFINGKLVNYGND